MQALLHTHGCETLASLMTRMYVTSVDPRDPTIPKAHDHRCKTHTFLYPHHTHLQLTRYVPFTPLCDRQRPPTAELITTQRRSSSRQDYYQLSRLLPVSKIWTQCGLQNLFTAQNLSATVKWQWGIIDSTRLRSAAHQLLFHVSVLLNSRLQRDACVTAAVQSSPAGPSSDPVDAQHAKTQPPAAGHSATACPHQKIPVQPKHRMLHAG